MYRTDILLFGTMGEIGPDVRRQLVSHGLTVESADFPQNVFRDEAGYRRTLVTAIAACRPEYVFPIGNTVAMSRFRALVEQGVSPREAVNCRHLDAETAEAVVNAVLVVEKEETVRLLDSKVGFYEFASRLGLRQPARYNAAGGIPENGQVIFKRDISFGGHGVHRPKDLAALRNLIGHQSPGEAFMIEEYIEGYDYSLDVVRHGSEMTSGGYRCISSRINGPADKRIMLPEGDGILLQMRECAATILENLDYQGVCGFDFRSDTHGNACLLECNPRFTGGVSAQAAAGFDIPWTLYSGLRRRP